MATELATPAELAQVAQAQLRSQLDPGATGAVDLNAGSKNDLMVSVNSALYNRVNISVADRVAARSIQSATGDDLDIIAQDVYSDSRKVDVAAQGFVYLQRTTSSLSPAFGATVIPNGSRFSVPATSTVPAVTFAANGDFQVASGISGQSIAVPIICTQTGAVGNVLLANLTALTDPLPDSGWFIYVPLPGDPVLNGAAAPQPIGGGADPESDDQLRARLQLGALDDSKKRGTKRAIEFGAMGVPGVFQAVAVEPNDGTVALYVGDASYALPSALSTAVATEIENWRAFGVPVFIRPFVLTKVSVTATVYMSRPLVNYNTQSISTQAIQAVINYFNNRPRPDEYFTSAIVAAIASSSLEVQSVTLSAPGSDQKRPADSNYGSQNSINRYVVDNTTIAITVLGPQTQ